MRKDGPSFLRPVALWPAGLALGALYALASLAAPIGNVGDDALHLLLARSLNHGAFALPDALGFPVNDPLPGFAALLCLPVRLVEPRWELLKILGPLCAFAALAFVWRLTRRFMTEGWALSAVLLTALNPLWVERVGLILPDLLFLALSLMLFDAMTGPESSGAAVWLAAGAALASMLRPEGALLVLSLGIGILADRGWKKASAFIVPAFFPLALWTLRNRLLTGAESGYAVNLRSEVARLAEPRAAAAHALSLLASLGGNGLLALRGRPWPWLAAAGLTAGVAAAAGAVRLLKRRENPRVFSIACYGVFWAVQHWIWVPVTPRYVIPMIPFAWLMILAGVQPPLDKIKFAGPLLLAVLSGAALRPDLTAAARGLRGNLLYMPATISWIQEHTPAQARIESLEWAPVALFSRRQVILPRETPFRDAWLAWALRQKIGYVLINGTFQPDGYFPPSERALTIHLRQWALSTPYGRKVYENDQEGNIVVRLEHPDPARYLKAWDTFEAAGTSARLGRPPAEIRAKIEQALRMEPGLAIGWAALAGLENNARAKRRMLERAAKLDPTSEIIRSDLAQVERFAAP